MSVVEGVNGNIGEDGGKSVSLILWRFLSTACKTIPVLVRWYNILGSSDLIKELMKRTWYLHCVFLVE